LWGIGLGVAPTRLVAFIMTTGVRGGAAASSIFVARRSKACR
jgi:hypothetical protein